MTTGAKIKYLRTRMGITQSKLAELTGIHHVSIGKYESDVMTPKLQQINRLAAVFSVSPSALIEMDTNVRLETIGDIFGVLIRLIKEKIIFLEGERDKNGVLKAETVSVKINPLIMRCFKIHVPNIILDATCINFSPMSYLYDLLKWENANSEYEKRVAEFGNSSNKIELEVLEKYGEIMDKIELELQRSNILINQDGGLHVKILPDILG